MAQRGRPRHPDLLTPREWEVLSLVREGLTNREIGDRLGVSKDGIKYHIAQILTKLAVSTREEAAAWQPAREVAAAERAATPKLSRLTRIGLIGGAAAVLAGLAVLAAAVAYGELSGGDSTSEPREVLGGGPPTASPAASASDSADAPPVATYGKLGAVAHVKDGDLWVLDLDTGEDRKVATSSEVVGILVSVPSHGLAADGPEWSADGQWISVRFILNGDPRSLCSPFVVRVSDGLLQSGGGCNGSDWSPTDLLLYGGGEVGGYFMQRPIGSFPESSVRIVIGEIVSVWGRGDAKFSPNAQSVAVVESDLGLTGSFVAIRDVSSTAPRSGADAFPMGNALFSTDDPDAPPMLHSWSPDGKYLLFWTGPGDEAAGEMTLLPVDNPDEARTFGPVPVVPSAASWSVDGSLLLVVELSEGGSHLRALGMIDGIVASHSVVEPAYSLTSLTAAYSQNGHIQYIVGTGTENGELTNDPAYVDRFPQWSADGEQILFVRLDSEAVAAGVAAQAELWLMNRDGSDQHKVGNLPPIDATEHVDWSRYLSWYRPTGIAPLETAPPPTPNNVPVDDNQ